MNATSTRLQEAGPLPLPARAAVSLEQGEGLDSTITLAGRITAPLGQSALARTLSGEWMGHALHPPLTDIPLGFWTSASVLDLVGGSASRTASRRLVGLGLLAALPTAASGWTEWHGADRPVQRVGVVHAGLNVAALALMGCSWAARRRGRTGFGAALGFAGVGLTGVASYLGGHMASVRKVSSRHPAFEDYPEPGGSRQHDVGAARRTASSPSPHATATDVVAVVTAQHAQITQLVRAVGLAPTDERGAALQSLLAYLAGHEAVEEELLHPRAGFDDNGPVGQARMTEETSVGEQIKRLEELGPQSEVFRTQFGLIEESIARHASAEEEQELPRLAAGLGDDDAATIVRAFEAQASSAARRHGSFADMLEQAKEQLREVSLTR
ncbi:DUF2231 domain-containing protein [Monashia sp. NPDC004114]